MNGVASARKLTETLEKNGSSLVGIQQNLVDLVWGEDRPARPSENVRVHPVKYAGKAFQDKVADLRKELETKKKAGFVICKEGIAIVYEMAMRLTMSRSYA